MMIPLRTGFVRSGYLLINGPIWFPGEHGYLWSSSALSRQETAYYFSFDVNGVNPSVSYEYGARRLNVRPIRCLAR